MLRPVTEPNSWDAAARARVSDRWADAAALWNKAMTDALLSATELRTDSVVLDLAAGSGDPSLSIAERLTTGRIIALDSSHASLLLATTHAQRLGLMRNLHCIQADAHAIPLKENCADRITCRCGIMFFNEIGMVMSEVLRVLKP